MPVDIDHVIMTCFALPIWQFSLHLVQLISRQLLFQFLKSFEAAETEGVYFV